jgi:hypothetical protein
MTYFDNSNLNKTKVLVRTYNSYVADFQTSSYDARIAFISNSSNIQNAKNIFYIGISSNSESYIAYDNNMHIDKIIKFGLNFINLETNTYFHNLLPSSNNLFYIGNSQKQWRNAYINNDLCFDNALIYYDNNSNELSFNYVNQNTNKYAPIQAKQISLNHTDSSTCILSVSKLNGVQLISRDKESDLISDIVLSTLSTSTFKEEGNLYYTDERVSNVIKSQNKLISSNYILDSVDVTSNILLASILEYKEILTGYINSNYLHITCNLYQEYDKIFIQNNSVSVLSAESNIILNHIQSNITNVSNYLNQITYDILEFSSNLKMQMLSNLYSIDNISSNSINGSFMHINADIINTSNNLVSFMKNSLRESLEQIELSFRDYDHKLYEVYEVYDYSSNISNMLINDIAVYSNLIYKNLHTYHSNVKYDSYSFTSNILDILNTYSSNKFDYINRLKLDEISDGKFAKIIKNNIYDNDLIVSNLTTIGHIIPFYDDTFSIGTSNNAWNDIFLSGNTIYMGNSTIYEESDGISFKTNDMYTNIIASKIQFQDTNNPDILQDLQIINDDLSIYINPQSISRVQYTANIQEGSNLFYKTLYAMDIAYSSNIFVIDYIQNNSNYFINRIHELSFDDIQNGTSNRFIKNGIYESNLLINGIVYTSNLNIIGNIISKHSEFEVLRINQVDIPALKIMQSSNNHVAQFYSKDICCLLITYDGKISIGSHIPTAHLDIIGNINVSKNINQITSNELDSVRGLNKPLQKELNDIPEFTSNYIRLIHDDLYLTLMNSDINMENIKPIQYYVDNACNIFQSNMYDTFDDLHQRLSNSDNSITQLPSVLYNVMSKITDDISSNINLGISNLSDELNRNSNHIYNQVSMTSNQLQENIINLPINHWTISNSNAYYMNNVGIGTNVIDCDGLKIYGNIKFSASLNNVYDNVLMYLDTVDSPIQAQLDNVSARILINSSNTSNNFVNLVLSQSNMILKNSLSDNTNLQQYIDNVSNILYIQNQNTSNTIENLINTKILGGSGGYIQSQWNRSKINSNISTEYSVGIGTSIINDTTKLQVYGDMCIAQGNLKKTNGNFTEYYQLERWKNSATYDTDEQKYIYYDDGKVGICIQNPVPYTNLQVGVSNLIFSEQGMKGFNAFTSSIQTSNAVDNVCSIFESSIWSKGNVASASDVRIKTNISNIDDDSALQKIVMIEPKTYAYIDPLKGTSNVYGFIAQQIKKIIPEAVRTVNNIVPNIFAVCKCTSNLVYLNHSNIIQILPYLNKKISIMDYNGNYDSYTLMRIDYDNSAIELDKMIMTEKVFIYGTEVDDFHVLDKSYIFTLNVCATQTLAREIDCIEVQLKELENLLNISDTDYLQIL